MNLPQQKVIHSNTDTNEDVPDSANSSGRLVLCTTVARTQSICWPPGTARCTECIR